MGSVNSFNSVWCYSIYGTDAEKYYEPMLSNIKIAKHHGVALVLHTNKKSETQVRNFFRDNLEEIMLFVHNDEYAEYFPKILRYLSSEKIDSKFYFFKDSDSIVTLKEIEIMNRWMHTSNPIALIIRDHPLHISLILAGMFGANKNLSQYIAKSAEEFFLKRKPGYYNKYSYDQVWLARKIYPTIVDKADVNTSFFYYREEKITRIKIDLKNHQYIGAQAYKQSLNSPENLEGYLRLYGPNLLTLPYFPKLSFLYGRVRPTLAVAYLFCKFLKISSNWK